MSKRFTDTEKWKNPWYRKLPSSYRDLWNYILDMCDNAGIWRVDLELASMIIGGLGFTHDEAMQYFGKRVVEIDHDKWFIPSFIEFQYGELKSDCPPHKSVIRNLDKHGIDPILLTLSEQLPNPIRENVNGSSKGINTLQEKDKEKDKDKAKDSYGGVGEILTPGAEITPELIDVAWGEWCSSLGALEIPGTNISPTQQVALFQAIKAHGFQNVCDALEGFRYEKPGKGYDPKNHASLDFVFKINPKTNKSNWERMGNVARAEREKRKHALRHEDAEHIAIHGRHPNA